MRSRAAWFWAASLLIALRAIPLADSSVWYDELYSIKLAGLPWPEMLRWIPRDVHPALHYIWLHAFISAAEWLGDPFRSLAFLRLSSVLPAVAVPFVLAWWGRRARGESAALLVFLMAAASPPLCFYSQELRNYSLVILFSALSGASLVCLLDRPSWRPALVFAASSAAQFHTHALAGALIACNIAWLLLQWSRRPRGQTRFQRSLPLWAAALTLAMCAPELARRYGMYLGNYQRLSSFLPEFGWTEMVSAFVYELPAGMVYGQAWFTPYGLLVCGIVLLGAVAAARSLRRRPARLLHSPLVMQTAAYCLFSMALFIFGLGIATALGVGKFFTAQRAGMFVLPQWIMLAGLLIDSISPASARRDGRRVLLAFLVFGSVMALWQRSRLLDAFSPFLGQDPEIQKMQAAGDFDVYVLDDELFPWLKRRPGGFQAASLTEFLSRPAGSGRRAALFTVNFDRLIGSDDDLLAYAFASSWQRSHRDSVLLKQTGAVRRFLMESNDLDLFRKDLSARINDSRKGNHRASKSLSLTANASDFADAAGLDSLEFYGDSPFRWTLGPRQVLRWTAPPTPGAYLLSLDFFRPGPAPAPGIKVAWSVNNGAPATTYVEQNRATLQMKIDVRRPRELMTAVLSIPTLVPAEIDPNSKDRRELGLMFQGLRMEKEPVPAP